MARSRWDYAAARRIEQLIQEGAIARIVELLTLEEREALAKEYELTTLSLRPRDFTGS